MLQLSSTVYSGGLGSFSAVHRATARIVSVDLRLSFRLSKINCSILQQPQMLSLCPILLPLCGYLTTASACLSRECRFSPAHSLIFPSFLHPLSFAWICIFLSSDQKLLPAQSWCSVRSSASKDVFLMHPWREMYSSSHHFGSSPILVLFRPLMPANWENSAVATELEKVSFHCKMLRLPHNRTHLTCK